MTKAKISKIALIIASISIIIGSFLKISHYPGASLLLIAGLVLYVPIALFNLIFSTEIAKESKLSRNFLILSNVVTTIALVLLIPHLTDNSSMFSYLIAFTIFILAAISYYFKKKKEEK